MIGIYSPGIWRIPHLEKFLAQPCQKLSLLRPVPQEVDAIAVWGHRPSAAKPVAISGKTRHSSGRWICAFAGSWRQWRAAAFSGGG